MAERVQQSKLAALGRLSASIAHEIRNPVGAMSHAGQLLAESPSIGPEERRLTDIIRSNSERVSSIINNVLQLSRREATKPTRLTLGDWLEEFVRRVLARPCRFPRSRIGVREEADDLEVRFDPSHLHQAVWNLCDNAIKYGEARDGIAVEIKLEPPEPELPTLSGGCRPRTGHRRRRCRSHLRAFFYRPQGRHGTWTLHRARTVSAQPRHPALRAAQRRRQRLSESSSATRSAGRNSAEREPLTLQ